MVGYITIALRLCFSITTRHCPL